MIQLTAIDFDPFGFITLHELPSSELSSIQRRSNRVATLDGGAVFNDTGYSAADRTFNIKWRIRSRDEIAQVRRLLKLHRFIRVSTREGMFEALPQSLSDNGSEGDLTLLIKTEY